MFQTRSIAAIVVAFTLAACSENGTINGPELTSSDTELASLLASESGSPRGEDARGGGSALFDRLAAEIPGFGGLYRTERCAVNIVLTDYSQAEHAVRVVKAAIDPLVARSCPDGIRAHPVEGQFTYIELQRWLHAARPLLDIRGVNGVQVNYAQNRLVVLVSSHAVVAAVKEALARLGIPEAAVVFQGGGAPGGRD
jgi:hypothetical protein